MQTEDNLYAAPKARVDDISESPNPEAEAIRRNHIKHEVSIKSIGLLFMLGGGSTVFASVAIAVSEIASHLSVVPSAMLMLLGVGITILGFALRMLRRWAQIPAVLACVVGLLGFPVGTLLNAYFLWVLLSKKGRFIMSAEYAEIVAATPGVKYKTSIVVKILLGIVVIGILVLLAPTLMR